MIQNRAKRARDIMARPMVSKNGTTMANLSMVRAMGRVRAVVHEPGRLLHRQNQHQRKSASAPFSYSQFLCMLKSFKICCRLCSMECFYFFLWFFCLIFSQFLYVFLLSFSVSLSLSLSVHGRACAYCFSATCSPCIIRL